MLQNLIFFSSPLIQTIVHFIRVGGLRSLGRNKEGSLKGLISLRRSWWVGTFD